MYIGIYIRIYNIPPRSPSMGPESIGGKNPCLKHSVYL